MDGNQIPVIMQNASAPVQMFKFGDVSDLSRRLISYPDDDTVMSWDGIPAIKITRELLEWSNRVAERMKRFTTPECIARYRDISEETVRMRRTNDKRIRSFREMIDQYMRNIEQLEKGDEERVHEDVRILHDEMYGWVPTETAEE